MHESHDIFARMSATAPLPRGLYRDTSGRVSRPDGNDLEFTVGDTKYRASLWPSASITEAAPLKLLFSDSGFAVRPRA